MSPNSFCPRDCILIVDDDDLQRELIHSALDDLGLPIFEAANGAEAVEAFAQRSPMLVVMDINMPVMDGYEACRRMKMLAGGDGAAVILVTGSDDLESVRKGYDAGAMEFLTKPFEWPLLKMRVQYLLRIQQTYLGLQENLGKLAWAQRAAGVGSWEFHPKTGLFSISCEAAHMLDIHSKAKYYTLEQLQKVVYAPDWEILIAASADLLENNVPLNLDVRMILGNGKPTFVHIHGEYLGLDQDERTSLSGTVQNITSHKIAEEQIKEASHLKDQFLANMSHELRTPINGILGMVELLKQTDLDQAQVGFASCIKESTSNLLTVLDSVLDFSSLETNKIQLRTHAFELYNCLDTIGNAMTAKALAKNLTVEIHLDENMPQTVTGDKMRLIKVLSHLTENAVKFTPDGTVTFSVTPVEDNIHSGWIRFKIKDTGIGISLEKQKQVFESFQQVDGSLTRQHGGLGLGLTISMRLVRLMGGDIRLHSIEGAGTTISLELPLPTTAGSEDQPGSKRVHTETNLRGDNSRIHILLVEDNRINQVVAKAILEKLGFKVSVAANGEEALAEITLKPYGAVFMDCQMPVMDGYEATRRIRNLGGNFQKLPIIALTAHALEGDQEKCLSAGMDDYLAKPASGKQILATLDKWLPVEEPMPA